jgi:hypothetical protein
MVRCVEPSFPVIQAEGCTCEHGTVVALAEDMLLWALWLGLFVLTILPFATVMTMRNPERGTGSATNRCHKLGFVNKSQ